MTDRRAGREDPWEELAQPQLSARWDRKRQRMREEIARNRRGEYTVPTWLLTSALLVIVGLVAAFLIFG